MGQTSDRPLYYSRKQPIQNIFPCIFYLLTHKISMMLLASSINLPTFEYCRVAILSNIKNVKLFFYTTLAISFGHPPNTERERERD